VNAYKIVKVLPDNSRGSLYLTTDCPLYQTYQENDENLLVKTGMVFYEQLTALYFCNYINNYKNDFILNPKLAQGAKKIEIWRAQCSNLSYASYIVDVMELADKSFWDRFSKQNIAKLKELRGYEQLNLLKTKIPQKFMHEWLKSSDLNACYAENIVLKKLAYTLPIRFSSY